MNIGRYEDYGCTDLEQGIVEDEKNIINDNEEWIDNYEDIKLNESESEENE